MYERICHQKDFDDMRHSSKQTYCGAFIMRSRLQKITDCRSAHRLGIIASRKSGNAVIRNRIKRRLREIFRLNQSSIPYATDIIIIAHRNTKHATYWELDNKFKNACRKLFKG